VPVPSKDCVVFWFSPETLEFKGFHLVDGKYHNLQPNEQGQFWSQQLQLFLGIHEQKLRFFTPEGELVPTPEEVAKAEQQRNQRLAAKLRELNIDPETL
jgi:hypothetical protein